MPGNALIFQIALTMIPDVGPIIAKKLIDYIGPPEEIFREQPSRLRKIPGIGHHLAHQVTAKNYPAAAEEEVKRMEKHHIIPVYYQDKNYPNRLRHCEDSPLVLYTRGQPDFKKNKLLSIVGTRRASSYGKDITRDIVAKLATDHPDLIIVSGLAYGIDIMAHRAALENGLDTFAILAHGLHTIYPPPHSSYARRIMEQGALLSDFPTSMQPERNNFLRRNRIIAGLSEATLVVESGKKGGALITAGLASSYSREVFAIPGRIGDERSSGCNALVKSNIAALVESAHDIEQILGWETSGKPQGAISNNEKKTNLQFRQDRLTADEQTILSTLGNETGIGQEMLSEKTGIPLTRLMTMMLQLEMGGWIEVLPGNRYRRKVMTSEP